MASCSVSTLVEVYDDVNTMLWTSLNTNTFYSKFFDVSQTVAGPTVKVNANTVYAPFTAVKIVQVRVTYTATYS